MRRATKEQAKAVRDSLWAGVEEELELLRKSGESLYAWAPKGADPLAGGLLFPKRPGDLLEEDYHRLLADRIALLMFEAGPEHARVALESSLVAPGVLPPLAGDHPADWARDLFEEAWGQRLLVVLGNDEEWPAKLPEESSAKVARAVKGASLDGWLAAAAPPREDYP